MKTIYKFLSLSLMLSLSLTSCMDDIADPNTDNFAITSKVSVGDVNTTIGELKSKYCVSEKGATYSRNSSNWEFLISDNLVFDGVVCSNDGPFGALYQSIYVRKIDGSKDECIQVGIKNTCLYPYFAIGQRIKINLKGLYVGVYGKSPKIGYPYFTSADNHNLGPIPLDMCRKNFELIGAPDPTLPECQPVDLTGESGYRWLHASVNRKIENFPILVTVEGKFTEADGVKTLSNEEEQDDGYAVNREFAPTTSAGGNTTKMIVRTSSGTEVSHIVMPVDQEVQLTGVMTFDSYDSKWQIQLRDTADFKIK
ncbi:MAG: hypothetical protein KBT20_08995 [Bacteroidales bacterium]|nr:hypothetical protein [Candidatus Liminaster caballi]